MLEVYFYKKKISDCPDVANMLQKCCWKKLREKVVGYPSDTPL